MSELAWQDAGWKNRHLVRADGKILGGVNGAAYEWSAHLRTDTPPYTPLGQYADEGSARKAVERAVATPSPEARTP